MRELRLGKAATVGEVTLIPLYHVQTHCVTLTGLCWLHGIADPFAVVIVDPTGVRAVGVDGSEVSIEDLLEQVPGLACSIPR